MRHFKCSTDGFYSPATLIRDAVKHGVVVLPVDLARSFWDCTLEANQQTSPALAVRLGLRFVEGLGGESRAALEQAWQRGSFVSLADVVERSGLAAADLKVLAKAGAFQSFCADRRQALWQVLALLRPQRPMPLLEFLGQESLEDSLEEALPSMSEVEQMVADYRTMHLSTGPHPMSFYRQWARRKGINSCQGLRAIEDGEYVQVAGSVICRQRPGTAKGFVFLTLEDESGMANVIVKPKLFDVYRQIIMNSSFLRVEGRLQMEQGVCNVIARHFESLPPLSDDLAVPTRNFH